MIIGIKECPSARLVAPFRKLQGAGGFLFVLLNMFRGYFVHTFVYGVANKVLFLAYLNNHPKSIISPWVYQ